MRPITLHPSSLLVGAGVALLAVVSMGQGTVSNRVQVPVVAGIDEGLQRPPAVPTGVPLADWVFITRDPNNHQGTSPDYVVPMGRTLVLTGILNRQNDSQPVAVRVGSSLETAITTAVGRNYVKPAVRFEAPTTQGFKLGPILGFRVAEGEEVRLEDSTNLTSKHGHTWLVGYLVDNP